MMYALNFNLFYHRWHEYHSSENTDIKDYKNI
jgi:hypothetical protein